MDVEAAQEFEVLPGSDESEDEESSPLSHGEAG